jgi:chromosome segregation ATPase
MTRITEQSFGSRFGEVTRRGTGILPVGLNNWGFLACCLILSAGSLRAAADSGNPEGDRMRAALRESTQQLRSVQTELTSLQATQATLADEKKLLTEKYETLKKQAVIDRAATDKTLAELQTEVTAQKAQLARVNDALEKSKTEGASSAQAHLAAETQNVRLRSEYYALQRRLTELESKNLALFLIGNEILTRYEDFSLGNALSAKEPFVGTTRAKLENLVQSYQDKLLDQRAK